MADLPQAPVSPPPAKLDYQPVSGWAVAAIVLGVLIAVLVLGTFFLSVIWAQPMFLPSWAMVVGLAGIVVSFIARRAIQFSEGTRIGLGLAVWGMWLSVFSVLGYFAFTVATEQALYQQANAFLMDKEEEPQTIPEAGFFPRLRDSGKDPVQANLAFLLTLPTASRTGNPHSEKDMNDRYNVSSGKTNEPGRLSQFRQNWLFRLVQATTANDADDTTVTFEPGARVSCKYDPAKRHYVVTRIYRITTPEVVLDATIQVISEEAPEPGVRRRWIVAVPQIQEMAGSRHETPLGENLKVFRREVYNQLVQWNKAHPSRPMALKDETDYEKLFPEPLVREHVQHRLKEPGPNDMTIGSPSQFIVTPWKMVGGKLQMVVLVRVPIAERVGPAIAQIMLEGQVIVESATPINPRDSNIDAPAWNIISIKWTGYQGGKRFT